MSKKTIIKLFLATLVAWVTLSCAKPLKPGLTNNTLDEFYESTRFIMLKNEEQLYLHLPDEAARKDFIKEFWEKRNPAPSSDENEAREEYARRVEFVDRWFREKVGSGRGWESDRGRIYLMLGEPDERSQFNQTSRNRRGPSGYGVGEAWVYSKYRIVLRFYDSMGFGVLRLLDWSPDLLAAIENAKFSLYSEPIQKNPLKFKASANPKGLAIKIPVKNVLFDEKQNEKQNWMSVNFKFTVFIYMEYKKIHTIEAEKNFSYSKQQLLALKWLKLTIPYELTRNGKYLFDIFMEDTSTHARYRDIIKYKHKGGGTPYP